MAALRGRGCEGKHHTGKGNRCNKGYPPAERGIKQSQRNAGQQGQVWVFCLQGRTEQDHRTWVGGGGGGGGEPLRGWQTSELQNRSPNLAPEDPVQKERTTKPLGYSTSLLLLFIFRPVQWKDINHKVQESNRARTISVMRTGPWSRPLSSGPGTFISSVSSQFSFNDTNLSDCLLSRSFFNQLTETQVVSSQATSAKKLTGANKNC